LNLIISILLPDHFSSYKGYIIYGLTTKLAGSWTADLTMSIRRKGFEGALQTKVLGRPCKIEFFKYHFCYSRFSFIPSPVRSIEVSSQILSIH
ncbi:MAG: hypothetical protein M3146_06655, partial [Thermoproteota archaeon]|nr:hypothetical protein [Thermoproteota archaeon]